MIEVIDMVRELTASHMHAEPYSVKVGETTFVRRHHTRVPSLLWQLEHVTPTGNSDDAAGAGFQSRPAAWLESLDTLASIDVEASRWLRELGEDDPDTTSDCVRRVGSLLPSADSCGSKPRRDCCTRHEIERDVRRWYSQARVVTGWESPAWRPANTCPVCGQRGGLRVRLLDQSALCVECRETWDPTSIGLLAEHIRQENFDLGEAS